MTARALRSATAATLATLATLALALPASAAAITYMPDPAAADLPDVDPDDVCATAEGECSLRAAVMEGGVPPVMDTTILLQPGTYELSLAGGTPPPPAWGFAVGDVGGDLEVWGPMAVVGSGASETTIVQRTHDRVFEVQHRLELSGVTITGGQPVGPPRQPCAAHDGTPGTPIFDGYYLSGGGILNSGHLILSHAVVTDNRLCELSRFGGGVGGGIASLPPPWLEGWNGQRLELDHVRVTENVSGQNGAGGGGIAGTGTGRVRFSTIARNTAQTDGGGVSWRDGGLELRNSLVASNTADGDGGGIRFFHGPHDLFQPDDPPETRPETNTIADTTIRGNIATQRFTIRGGGGLSVGESTSARVERSTLVGNEATQGGGARIEGLARFTNSTLSGNSAQFARLGGAIDVLGGDCPEPPCPRHELVLESSTLAGNTAGGVGSGILEHGERPTFTQAVGTVFANGDENCDPALDDSVGWNLEQGTSCNLDGPGDLSSTDPLLGPLRDNGGPTRTHHLMAGSPAIDANAFSRCPQLDQRTALRPGGARCDIGSYERGAIFLSFPLRPREPRFVGGSADLELLPIFATSLSKEGISLEPAGGAEKSQGDGMSLPVGDGRVTARHSGLNLDGWLFVLDEQDALGLSRIEAVVNRKRGFIAARLGSRKRQIRLFALSEVKRGPSKDGGLTLSAQAALAPPAAKVLNRSLGARLRPGMPAATLAADVALVAPSTDPGPPQGPVEPIEPPPGQ